MRYLLILGFLLSLHALSSQDRKGINYQGLARDSVGNAISNQQINVRISILAESISGGIAFQETHLITTNDIGYFTLIIGSGEVKMGEFDQIKWDATDYYIKTEIDVSGGSDYLFFGTSQIMAVPYAYYAEKAGAIEGGIIADNQNLLFPDGVEGEPILLRSGDSYTVPVDKNLYMLSASPIQFEGVKTDHFIGIFGGNSTLTIIGSNRVTSCLLVDEKVEIVTKILPQNSTYVVPSGKTFYNYGLNGASFSTSLSVNGNVMWYKSVHVIMFPEGTVLANDGSGKIFLNGYLKIN